MVDFRLRPGPVTGAVAVLAVMSVGLGGCSGFGRALGMSKTSPDEFAVVTKAPLVMPPDYELRPPKPGAERPQEIKASEAAKQALFPNAPQGAGTPSMTAGEQALVANAGTNSVNPEFRKQIAEENALVVRKSRSFANLLLFGKENAIPASLTGAAAQRPLQAESTATGTATDPAMGETTDQPAAEDAGQSAGEYFFGSGEAADQAAGADTSQAGDQSTDQPASEETSQTADEEEGQESGDQQDQEADQNKDEDDGTEGAEE